MLSVNIVRIDTFDKLGEIGLNIEGFFEPFVNLGFELRVVDLNFVVLILLLLPFLYVSNVLVLILVVIV